MKIQKALVMVAALVIGTIGSQGQEREAGPEGRGRFAYQDWLATLKIPVITRPVRDVMAVPVQFWEELGVPAAYLRLANNRMIDAVVVEIANGSNTKPEVHMFEEMIYVAKGSGYSTYQQSGRRVQQVNWQEGSLFSPPLNVRHQHFGTGPEAARLIMISSRPSVIQTVGNAQFLNSAVFSFTDRYDAEEDFFKKNEFVGGRDYQVNIVPDIRKIGLVEWDRRGAGYISAAPDMGKNLMVSSFTSRYPAKGYPKAHRHRNEAIIIQVSGKGYSLLWKEKGSPVERFDWQPGSIYSPELYWYHQHFNPGDEPAQYVGTTNIMMMTRLGVRDGDQLDYGGEPAEVRQIWEKETGLKYRTEQQSKEKQP